MYHTKVYKETWKGRKQRKTLRTTLNVVLKTNIATSLLLQEFSGLLAHKTSWSSQLSFQKYSTDQFSVAFFLDSLGKHQTVMSLGKLSWLTSSTAEETPETGFFFSLNHIPDMNCVTSTQLSTYLKGPLVFSPKGDTFSSKMSSTVRLYPKIRARLWGDNVTFASSTIHDLNGIYGVLHTYTLQENVSLEPAV